MNPGNGVELVDQRTPPVLLVEEVGPGHALDPERPVGLTGQILELLGHPVGQLGGDDELGVAVVVLVLVIVELGTGHDLARNRHLQIVIAQHRQFDLAGHHRFLDDGQFVVDERGLQRRLELIGRRRLAHADR